MTKRDFFVAIANKAVVTDEMVALANKYIDQLDNRNLNRKPSKNQIENEGLKEDILLVLGETGMTVTEVLKALGKEGITNQRISALMTQLVKDNKAIRTVEKRKAYFTLA